jgi:predicted nucleic acid-binding protein
VVEAQLAAKLYASVVGPRGREIDLVVAACALANGAALWTLNRRDFHDLEALRLI